MWTAKDAYRSRAYTCRLLDLVEQGMIDKDSLISDLLNWMSESEVAEFARRNDLIQEDPEEDEEELDPMDDFNYVGSRYHY